MKKILILFSAIIIGLTSCEKMHDINLFHKKDKPCAVVTADQIPSAVSSAFTAKYPGVSADKWFDKDGTGFSALFTMNGKKGLTQFNNDGSLVKEELDVDEQGDHQNGNHHDKNDDKGCECETGD
jgi:hypothetical protein